MQKTAKTKPKISAIGTQQKWKFPNTEGKKVNAKNMQSTRPRFATVCFCVVFFRGFCMCFCNRFSQFFSTWLSRFSFFGALSRISLVGARAT
jgi:hypothetical protein